MRSSCHFTLRRCDTSFADSCVICKSWVLILSHVPTDIYFIIICNLFDSQKLFAAQNVMHIPHSLICVGGGWFALVVVIFKKSASTFERGITLKSINWCKQDSPKGNCSTLKVSELVSSEMMQEINAQMLLNINIHFQNLTNIAGVLSLMYCIHIYILSMSIGKHLFLPDHCDNQTPWECLKLLFWLAIVVSMRPQS